MPQNKTSFSDRIKASARKKFEKEVNQFQTFDQEYKISSHPIKRTFLAIGKLNSIHRGEIGIQEISDEAELTTQDVDFILQEFIDQRLIDGYIRDDTLVLQQDFYYCQIDQTEHAVFELHFQCSRCLRFICANCYQKGQSTSCPYCRGKLIPVPRIFKEKDVQPTSLKPKQMKESLSEYYQTQRSSISRQGIRKVSSRIVEDFKSVKRDWSLSSLKEKTQNYWDYRKHEKTISQSEKLVLDTISVLYDIEDTSEIPLKRIASLTSLELKLIHEIISRLISQQSINGFIETGGTYDSIEDDKLILGKAMVFHCEIHDVEIPVSNAHYQCTSCFRAICVDCYATMKHQGIEGCLFCEGKLTYFPDKIN